MKNKVISALVSVVMIVSCLAAVTLPASAVPAAASDLKLPKMEAVKLGNICETGKPAVVAPGTCKAVAGEPDTCKSATGELGACKSARTYEIGSGSATWSWVQENGSTTGIAIDAMPPWMWPSQEKLPAGKYLLQWDMQPDSITVVPYTSKDGKTYEEVTAEVRNVHRPYVVNVKAGRVYAVAARWGEGHLQTDGRCGEVEYAFLT